MNKKRTLKDRKRDFRVALAIADMTASAFAEGINVSHVLVHNVLGGRATSRKVSDAIELFIKQNLPAQLRRVA